jgi:hypothetical protein
MTRTVLQLRCTDTQKARWKDAAGGNLSKWIARLADEEADRLQAEQDEADLLAAQAVRYARLNAKSNYEPDWR